MSTPVAPSTIDFWNKKWGRPDGIPPQKGDQLPEVNTIGKKECPRYMPTKARDELLEKLNQKTIFAPEPKKEPEKSGSSTTGDGTGVAGIFRLLVSVADRYPMDDVFDVAYDELKRSGQLNGSFTANVSKIVNEAYENVNLWYGDDIKEVLFITLWPKLKRFFGRGVAEWYKNRMKEEAVSGGGQQDVFPRRSN